MIRKHKQTRKLTKEIVKKKDIYIVNNSWTLGAHKKLQKRKRSKKTKAEALETGKKEIVKQVERSCEKRGEVR
jgi:hypothetical protein